MVKKIVLVVFSIAALLSCKQQKKNEKQFNGFVIWQEGYTTFTDCNTGKEYWLEDNTGQVAAKYKQIAKQPYQQVFFTFEADLLPPATMGPASAYNNIMKVTTLVSATEQLDEKACKMTLKKPVFDCMGDNPLWALSFSGQDIKFTASYPQDTMAFFPLAEPQVRDSAGVGKVFYYNIDNENFQNIQLIVTEKPCEMQGRINRFSVRVIFGTLEYNGCAKLKTLPNEQNPMPSTPNNPAGSM